MRILSLRLWCLLVLPPALGCGSSPVPVSGAVTVHGKPMEQGGIEFVPLEPTPENRARVGARVSAGVYSVSADRGPVPGKYRVEAFLLKATKKMSNGEGGEYTAHEHVVLPKYGETSDIVVDITSGENKLDISLTP